MTVYLPFRTYSRGNVQVDVFPDVKQLFRFAAAREIELDFACMPRETDAMLHADMLSRVEGSLEIFLSHQAFQDMCLQGTDPRNLHCN